jgi:hypothetical protein
LTHPSLERYVIYGRLLFEYNDPSLAIWRELGSENMLQTRFSLNSRIFFFMLRHLWTLPSRKQGTMSSSFPSTISIPNFKSISLIVEEFWKRYHWNCWSIKKFEAILSEDMFLKSHGCLLNILVEFIEAPKTGFLSKIHQPYPEIFQFSWLISSKIAIFLN